MPPHVEPREDEDVQMLGEAGEVGEADVEEIARYRQKIEELLTANTQAVDATQSNAAYTEDSFHPLRCSLPLSFPVKSYG